MNSFGSTFLHTHGALSSSPFFCINTFKCQTVSAPSKTVILLPIVCRRMSKLGLGISKTHSGTFHGLRAFRNIFSTLAICHDVGLHVKKRWKEFVLDVCLCYGLSHGLFLWRLLLFMHQNNNKYQTCPASHVSQLIISVPNSFTAV